MSERELTRANTRPVEIKRENDDGPSTLTGYGAVFYRADDPGTEFVLWGDGKSKGSAVERIMPGAFDELGDVRCMFNHDPNQLLGRTSANTLALTVDDTGLRYECQHDDSDPDHQRVAAKIERGDVDGSSFWFQIQSEEKRTEDGVDIYELTKLRTIEVGPVVMPAYQATTAETRSAHIEERKRQIQEREAKEAAEQAAANKAAFLETAKRKMWELEHLS